MAGILALPFKGITLLLSVYLGLCLVIFFLQERLLYFPDPRLIASPAAVDLEFETVDITTEDDLRLSAWWIPAQQARGVLLFCHGNAGNISHRLESIRQFHQLGLSVLIFDYRGYGESQGKPSEQGTYRDVMAVWRYLTVKRRIPAESVVVFGRSLGAAVAAHLAARVAPGVVILESAFTSVPDMAARLYPWLPVRWLTRIEYPVARDIQTIQAPVLILHSPADEIIPYDMGRTLYGLAHEPKDFVELRGGHNDGFLLTEPDYSMAIASFLQTHLSGSVGLTGTD